MPDLSTRLRALRAQSSGPLKDALSVLQRGVDVEHLPEDELDEVIDFLSNRMDWMSDELGFDTGFFVQLAQRRDFRRFAGLYSAAGQRPFTNSWRRSALYEKHFVAAKADHAHCRNWAQIINRGRRTAHDREIAQNVLKTS